MRTAKTDQTGQIPDLSLCWEHRSVSWFGHAAAYFILTVRGARTDMDTIKNLTDSLDLRYEQTRKLNSDVGDKLRKLKQGILEAREEANKVSCAAIIVYRATLWQNQQNGMCAQRRLRSAWAYSQSDQSLRCVLSG